MSQSHEITCLVPAHKKRLRKGRGESSGHGKTSGRGTKGAGARTGKPIKRGHEGGQTPIFRRLPIRGFSNDRFERDFNIVNVSDLQQFADGTVVDPTVLKDAGLIPDGKLPVKILGDGELTKKLTVVVGWYSKSALEKVTAAGGTAQNAKGEAFVYPKIKRKFPKAAGKKGGKAAAAPAEAEVKAPEAEAKPAAEEKPTENA